MPVVVADQVDHPAHYQSASMVCARLLRLHLGLTPEDLEMECIKYLWRCGNKAESLFSMTWNLQSLA
jgi:hypothetical protein